MADGSASSVKVSLKLSEKPSGCVLWIVLTPDLGFQSYLWLGGVPGEPLPDIRDLRVAKHTKANAEGIKAERQHHRIVPRGRFEKLDTLDAILLRLFGAIS